MNTFKSFAELNGKLLEWYDRIVFEYEGYKITAFAGHYGLINEIDNFIENKIFQLLSQTRLLPLGFDPFDFCKQHYTKLRDWEWDKKYYPNLWPTYCENDFESITKVVLELFRLIEEQKQLAETSEILFID